MNGQLYIAAKGSPITIKPQLTVLSSVSSLATLVMLMCFLSGCVSNGKNTSRNASQNAAQRGTDTALIHTQLAKGYLQQKQYAIAKSELEEALRINPKHSGANYVMALLMMELEQYDSAEVYFKSAVKNDPENASAAHDFGMFLCQINKERESIEYFDLAANNPLFGKRELSYMRAGECLAQIGDPLAEAYLKRALAVNDKLRPALYRLAEIKYQQHDYFLSRAYIERYFAITKPQPAALLLAFKIESKLNAEQVAQKYRSQLLEEFPGSLQASQLRRDKNKP